ncbi:hypothetical protein [Pseudofrankia asymbiotica]|uniref:Uncharacterized protein n=1 Tax=Pseudofrankia asymbiotica TaxID=1834516 RepID=A0A1V2I5L8_9ACTN|nr:hypothetical protein [Pseudofrankia asymbiotica]ONH24966.1 hypothetical protein BL253_28585 [Pseudofrankia asymbiotica]
MEAIQQWIVIAETDDDDARIGGVFTSHSRAESASQHLLAYGLVAEVYPMPMQDRLVLFAENRAEAEQAWARLINAELH